MNEKFIPTLNIISHYIVFLHQPEWQDVDYTLWFIPEMILIIQGGN